jgi:outer membrane receptor protein involved in Fe transport
MCFPTALLASLSILIAPSASAAGDTGSADALEQVVVTAQRRTEDLQSVPVSVQVIGSQTLVAQNHNTLEELTQTVPGVHIADNSFANDLFIRGIGSGAGSVGGDPSFDQSAAMFVDDIYRGRSRMTDATFLDLDRIEVLKGPQSTFFGNNAIAGALNIVTKKPGDTFDASARALYGMYGQYAVDGGVTVPISDKLSVRAAGTFNGMNGWAKNLNTGGHDPVVHNKAGRLTLLYNATDDLDATLKIEGGENKSGPNPLFFGNCPPPAPLPSGYNLYTCPQALALGLPVGLNTNTTADFPGQETQLSTFEGVLTINHHRWGQTFTSVTGFNNYHFENRAGGDRPDYFSTTVYPEKYHQVSQEFRLTSPTDQPIEYIAGAYYQTDHLDFTNDTNQHAFDGLVVPFPFLAPYLPLAVSNSFSQGETIYSIFGSLSWNVTDRLKLNTGLRESWIKKDFAGSTALGYGTTVYGGWSPIPPPFGPEISKLFGFGKSQTTSRSDRDWMPSAGIQYQIRPETMAYFSFSRGFKAGGFNGLGPGDPIQQLAFGPEHVNAYELGVKSKWFDDKLLVNLDVFREDYKDLQVSARSYNQVTNSYGSFVQNAATARSQGIELETQWVLTKDLRISANITYLDAHYVRFPNAQQTTLQGFCAGNSGGSYVLPYCSIYPNPVPGIADLSGTSLLFSPRWSGSVAISYSMQLPRDYKFTTALSPYFTSSYNEQDPYLLGTSGYVRLDARLTLAFPDGRWDVDLIGKNLTDRVIVTSYGNFGPITKQEPRNIAVQFRYHF